MSMRRYLCSVSIFWQYSRVLVVSQLSVESDILGRASVNFLRALQVLVGSSSFGGSSTCGGSSSIARAVRLLRCFMFCAGVTSVTHPRTHTLSTDTHTHTHSYGRTENANRSLSTDKNTNYTTDNTTTNTNNKTRRAKKHRSDVKRQKGVCA